MLYKYIKNSRYKIEGAINMGEYNGRINVTKDTMLFVVNSIFENNIKESTTKEDILKMMPEIYENADKEKIIEMLPYRAYKDFG